MCKVYLGERLSMKVNNNFEPIKYSSPAKFDTYSYIQEYDPKFIMTELNNKGYKFPVTQKGFGKLFDDTTKLFNKYKRNKPPRVIIMDWKDFKITKADFIGPVFEFFKKHSEIKLTQMHTVVDNFLKEKGITRPNWLHNSLCNENTYMKLNSLIISVIEAFNKAKF